MARIVHNNKQICCSDHIVKRRTDQVARNGALLQKLEAVNQEGDCYTLDELAELSVSNPRLRRGEMMARIDGFEQYVGRIGYALEFYTITCPSRFHATHVGGKPNENYQGNTARESNAYLVSVWSRARAALHRRAIDVFGFRVVEPHHDGTAHWHFLLWADVRHIDTVRELLRHYALLDNPTEKIGHSQNSQCTD